MTKTMEVEKIRIGERHRKNLGDVAGLAASIDDVGLLQPVVVTSGSELIAGARRIAAWKLSRFKNKPIPVHIVDLDAIVRGEFAENAERKNLTLSEMVAIKRSLEPIYRMAARERLAHGKTGPGKKTKSGAVDPTQKGVAADQIARLLGRDRKTLAKASAVVDAAESNPKKFGKLVAEMDKRGQAEGPFKQLSAMRGEEQKRPDKKPKSEFDRIILGEPVGGFSLPRLRNALKTCEWNVAFLTYLLEHASTPAVYAHSLREFEKVELVRRSAEYADRHCE